MKKKPYSQVDYQLNMLPSNRKEVFKDVFKLHFRTLVLQGLFLFLFSIPLQISIYLKEITMSDIYRQYANGQITLDETTTSIITMSNQFGMFNIIFIVFFGIGLSGVIRVIKRLSWYEPITSLSDFISGIKENGVQYGISFFLIGLLSFIVTVISNLSSLVEQSVVYEYLGLLPKIALIVLFSPSVFYLLVVISVYTNRLRDHFRLSLYLFMGSIISTFKNLLFLSIPFLVLLIPNFYVHLVGRILLVILFPVILLKWFLLASDTLDQKWNINHYPNLVNRGILGLSESNEKKG